MNPPGNAAPTILPSKLHPPRTSSAQVARTRLMELVRAAAPGKLIVVRAPAGFGKTTVLVQCRALLLERGVDSAWLTLDGGDNDPSRFLACLAAAVAQMTGDDAWVQSGRDDAGAPGDIALGIMERLASHGAPFALILDDFECIVQPTVLELVRELLDRLPHDGQLIVGSRSLPDLHLGRLRARGQLLEIDAGQLRFSSEETEDFLIRQRAIALSADDLARLHGKTEGWIAALWLASVSLQRHDDRSGFIARFSGSHDSVADYLAGDVLARQPPRVRDFLLRTSILRHLDPSVCDALLLRADSAQTLAELAAANLFLVPIEAPERTYRYHSLFADFLRAQLAAQAPGALTALHRAASHWYQQQDRPVPAIDHALDGGDVEHALALLARHAEVLLEQGRMRLLTRWFDRLPQGALGPLPLLQVIRAWALCFTRGPWEALALLNGSPCAASDDPRVHSYVLALRPSLHALMDDSEQALLVGDEALAHLPLLDAFAGSALANDMAYVCCFMGQRQRSHDLLRAARQRQAQGQGAGWFNQMYSESIEGVIDLEEGRLRQATARLRMAVRSTHAGTGTHTNGNAFAGILYADALYEANDLDQAARLLHVYLPLAKDVGLADHMIIGCLRLARIAFQHGDIDQMFQCLAELEQVGHQRQLPRVVASARLERARMFLMQGNRHASRDELDRANDAAIWHRVRTLRMPAHDLEYFDLGQWRWQIHFGDASATVLPLEGAAEAAAAQGRHRRALKLRVLACLARQRGGDARGALAGMTALLALTSGENFMRLVIDEGPTVGALARQVFDAAQPHHGGNGEPIFIDYLQRLMQGFGAAIDDAAPLQEALAEALTPREISVLTLLADGYSNSALAEKLFVSDSTVRTHLRNINLKMGVRSRMQAVSNARRLGLIG